MESEIRKGTFKGRKKGDGKKWDYFFDEGGEDDRKYSAFEPLLNLEQLKEGREYKYTVIHKPTKDDPNKYHHNIGRIGKDADFAIEWTGETPKQGTLEPKPTEAPNTKVSSYTPQPGRKDTDSREAYWAEREKRELEEKRIYELRLPYINAVNLMPGVCYIIGSMMQHSEGYEQVKKDGIDKTAELLLRQMESIVEQRLPKEAAYGAKNAPKKEEPIEAVV